MLLWKKHINNKKVNLLQKAIVSFETFDRVKGLSTWGMDIPKNITPIWGDEAERAAKLAHIRLGGPLLAECQYIFRWSFDHKILIPGRVSMHPKTMHNIERGYRKYGPKGG